MLTTTDLHNALAANTPAQWAGAIAVATVATLGLLTLRWLLDSRARSLTDKSRTPWDDALVDVLARTHWLVLLVVGAYVGAFWLTVGPRLAAALWSALVLAVAIQMVLWGNALIKFWLDRQQARRAADPASGGVSLAIVGFGARLIFYSIITLLAFDNLGFDVTALLASLGIGGVAMALAVQNILGDLFACLSISLDKPFQVGDFIIVDDMMGVVERVGLKTTRVRSLWGEQLVFANGDLLASRVRNYKRMRERRVAFTFGVAYQTPAAALKTIPDLVRQAIEAQQPVRFDRAHLQKFGDYAYIYEIVYYIGDPDYNRYMDIQQAINLAIIEAFERDNIRLAYPTQTIHMAAAPAQP